ncbi:MAG: hypothetical protein IKD06_00430 [Clostridia bacterium]|nr:hypothetical protein [Clostridia bacterium]
MKKRVKQWLGWGLALVMALSVLGGCQVKTPATVPTMPATQPVTEPEPTKPVTQPATEPEPTVPVTQPATEPEPTVPVTQPATNPEPTKPVTQPATNPEPTVPVTQPATEPEPTVPVTQPATEPEPTKPVTQPATDPEPTKPVTQPATNPEPTKPVTQPATEPETEPPTGIPVPEKVLGGFTVPAYYIPEEGTGLTSPQNTQIEFAPQHAQGTNSMAEFIGANHIWGGYTHLGYDGVTEGGIRMQQLGSKSIKVYLVNYYKDNYPVATDWGTEKIPNAVELAQHKHFRSLFDLDLSTYVIGTYIFDNSFGHPATYFINTWTEESRRIEYQQMYDLVYYLCKTYEGTGKSFIIQNWESDWSCMPSPDVNYDPPQEVFDRLIQWINTRQDAVMAARRDAGCKDVYVYNTLEVNLVDKAMQGKPCVTNNVIPYTYCDFYCYSAYDTDTDETKFAAALDYIAAKAASNRTGGQSRLYIGECGYPDSMDDGMGAMGAKVAETVIKVAREKGYCHMFWWALFDAYTEGAQRDQDFMGYWLVTYSGKLHRVWNVFYKAINGEDDPNYVPGPEEVMPEFPLYSYVDDDGDLVENGMFFRNLDYDGLCTYEQIAGRWCVKTVQNNVYYKISNLAITPEDHNVKVTITYYDEGTAPVQLQYNSKAGEIAKGVSFNRTNTKTWRNYTFILIDAGFNDLFHQGYADIRICDCGESLSISRVSITK